MTATWGAATVLDGLLATVVGLAGAVMDAPLMKRP